MNIYIKMYLKINIHLLEKDNGFNSFFSGKITLLTVYLNFILIVPFHSFAISFSPVTCTSMHLSHRPDLGQWVVKDKPWTQYHTVLPARILIPDQSANTAECPNYEDHLSMMNINHVLKRTTMRIVQVSRAFTLHCLMI